MINQVKARAIAETISEFYRTLADGAIAKKRPDGECDAVQSATTAGFF
jgi:hypothetical protein